jgi:hypothetical protein
MHEIKIARSRLATVVSSVAPKRLFFIASTRDWHPSAGNDPSCHRGQVPTGDNQIRLYSADLTKIKSLLPAWLNNRIIVEYKRGEVSWNSSSC